MLKCVIKTLFNNKLMENYSPSLEIPPFEVEKQKIKFIDVKLELDVKFSKRYSKSLT